jgi:hypothetical protein
MTPFAMEVSQIFRLSNRTIFVGTIEGPALIEGPRSCRLRAGSIEFDVTIDGEEWTFAQKVEGGKRALYATQPVPETVVAPGRLVTTC